MQTSSSSSHFQAQEEVNDFLLSSSITEKSMSVRTPSHVSFRANKLAVPRKSISASGKKTTEYKAKPIPNFNAAHTKQFSGLKSITNIVPRVLL